MLLKIEYLSLLLVSEVCIIMSNIEFISYTGKYPNLCSGVLTLKIDDKIVRFGYEEDYEPFWESGGRCGFDGVRSYIYDGEWVIDEYSDLKEFEPIKDRLIEVFNDNVEHGCCGGCL